VRLVKPWPEDKKQRSGFGYRTHPITGKPYTLHRGIDVGGTFEIRAPAAGVVHHIGYSGPTSGGGHTLRIEHGTRLFTVYYHLRERTPLSKGDRVDLGQFLGTSGSTGASTGPHLHFEVRTGRYGQWGTQVDPQPYLVANNLGAKPALRVDGRMGRNTWRAWQTQLASAGHYKGRVDGRPGRFTYEAIQRSLNLTVDGVLGPQTRRGVQAQLKAWGYELKVDGRWGRITYTALQRSLNDEKWHKNQRVHAND